MNSVRNLAVLGSTGSVGINTLDVAGRHPQRFRVFALAANRDVDKLFAQCVEFEPALAALADRQAAAQLRTRLREAGVATEVIDGAQAAEMAATHPEVHTVMAAIVGAAGLRATLAAARAGKKLLLANKESMVMAGRLLIEATRGSGAMLLPIDSEHNAIFQALPLGYSGDPGAAGVRRLLLTASGGPFRSTPLDQLARVTPEQACAHPKWVMGRKISVDSSTLMNKGLEVIEAHYLFNVKPEQIEVVIHPESVIHSLVEYVDGSVIAQLGNPDMRTPIAHALAFPDRIDNGVKPLDLVEIAALHFERPDTARFPCLRLAFEALRAGPGAAIHLNAANEIAVGSFLERRLAYNRIAALVEEVLQRLPSTPVSDLEHVLAADAQARRTAESLLPGTVH
ncbi:MAG: 1-deoxy-D-xylulose-5-phosphate reductoisomerase [Burkholderiales bacterium]